MENTNRNHRKIVHLTLVAVMTALATVIYLLLPEIPLYSNIYVSLFPDWLEGYDQDSFWDFSSAILYANIAGYGE